MQRAGAWDKAGEALSGDSRRLVCARADAIVITANTMHKVADNITRAVRVPLLHIADATGAAIKRAKIDRPLLLATRYTMEHEFYKGYLAAHHGIEAIVPDAAGRTTVHDIIYDELCQGIVKPESKRRFLDVIAAARGEGADGVIFGCTE